MQKLKRSFRKNAKFLQSVYKAKTRFLRKKAITNASESELDTLLLCLHCLMSGKVPIKAKLFPIINKSKRLPKIKAFTKTNINEKLKKTSLEEKVKFLSSIPCYPELLYNLFNKD